MLPNIKAATNGVRLPSFKPYAAVKGSAFSIKARARFNKDNRFYSGFKVCDGMTAFFRVFRG
jgi:hypothetical protein